MTILAAVVWLHSVAVPPPHATPAPEPPVGAVGWAFQYRPGVFAQVARNRGMRLDWSVDGFASTPRCDRVDAARPWYIVVRWLRDGAIETYQVVDCSDPRDLPAQRAHGLRFEVDHASAVRRGFAVYAGWHGAGKALAQIIRYFQPQEAAR